MLNWPQEKGVMTPPSSGSSSNVNVSGISRCTRSTRYKAGSMGSRSISLISRPPSIGLIQIEQLQTGCLQALYQYPRHAHSQFIAQIVILRAFSTQTYPIQGYSACLLQHTRTEMPAVGRKKPRPA